MEKTKLPHLKKTGFAELLEQNVTAGSSKYKPLTDKRLQLILNSLKDEHPNKAKKDFDVDFLYFSWGEKKAEAHFITKIEAKDGRKFYFDPNGCIGYCHGGTSLGPFGGKVRRNIQADGRIYPNEVTNINSLNYTNLHTTGECAYWFLAAATECLFESSLNDVISKFENKEMLKRISARFIKFKEFTRTKNPEMLSLIPLKNEEIDAFISYGESSKELQPGSISFLKNQEPQKLPAFAQFKQQTKSRVPLYGKSEMVSVSKPGEDSYIKIQADIHRLKSNSEQNPTNKNLLELFHISERIVDIGGYAKNVGMSSHEFVGKIFLEDVNTFNSVINELKKNPDDKLFGNFLVFFKKQLSLRLEDVNRKIEEQIAKNKSKLPLLKKPAGKTAEDSILHSINLETTPVGGGFKGQIAKKGMPGKAISSTENLPPLFKDTFKIENIQKRAEQCDKFCKKETIKQETENSYDWRIKVKKNTLTPNLSKLEHILK